MLRNVVRLIKRLVSKLLGSKKKFILEWLSAVKSFNLHVKNSFEGQSPDRDLVQLKYYLMKHCHIVEKGMSLPSPRVAFGQPKITDLIARTRTYESLGGEDVGDIVRDTLWQYRKLHYGKEEFFEPGFIDSLDDFIRTSEAGDKGGLKSIKKEEWNNISVEKFDSFVSLRHSVRDFDSNPVDPSLLKSAINVSLKTPSVCNRQGWFIHYYSEKKKIVELLSYQNGNSGFTETVDKLLIVTGNLKAFTRFEHNQLFVDGGLVSMNLLLSIHSAGLGACPLNTCMPYSTEKKLIGVAGIPENERLIMMIAVGNLKEEFSVAHSERYDLDRVLMIH